MSGWAGQLNSFEEQQKKNREDAERQRFNTNKNKTKKNYARRLGENPSVRNKLQVLHDTGHKNKYYGKRMNELNRGSGDGVLRKLRKHRAKKKYTSNGARNARGELLNNTIRQLSEELGGEPKVRGGSKVRGRRVLKNGTVAGYVQQKNGTWKWSFLAKSRN